MWRLFTYIIEENALNAFCASLNKSLLKLGTSFTVVVTNITVVNKPLTALENMSSVKPPNNLTVRWNPKTSVSHSVFREMHVSARTWANDGTSCQSVCEHELHWCYDHNVHCKWMLYMCDTKIWFDMMGESRREFHVHVIDQEKTGLREYSIINPRGQFPLYPISCNS